MSYNGGSTRVVLVDDHALVRAGLLSLLRTIPSVDVIAEGDSAASALQLVRDHRPDVVVLNVSDRGLEPRSTTAQLVAELPALQVVVIAAQSSQADVLAALQAGAKAYLVKDSSPHELGLAFGALARGETYLSPSASRHVVADYIRISNGGNGTPRVLSPRQREILCMIAQGLTSKEIAKKLGLSVKTVETHRTQLMSHLGIHQVAGLVRYAIRTGLVSADE